MMSRCAFGCEENDGLWDLEGWSVTALWKIVRGPSIVFLGQNAPHRLQRVCDLLWRLPKLDVPLAV
jgi:hypothetical protein